MYGIRESEICFNKALIFQDLTPLLMRIQTKATGDDVKKEIEMLEQKIGKVSYAVGDYGSNIKNGLKQLGISHIHDVTHAIALIIEKLFKDDEEFIAYSKEMALLRNKISQTQKAIYMPPKPRLKSRFHNIEAIAKWGLKTLKCLNKNSNIIENDIKEKIQWIFKYENIINDLYEINAVSCSIQKLLKTNGFSKTSIQKCNNFIKKLTTKKGAQFSLKLNEYFKSMKTLLPDKKNILCTSDIIESAFGKYKNYVSNNPMAGVTKLALCLIAFTTSFSNNEIIEALEKTTIGKVIEWSNKEIGDSFFKRRKLLFNSI